MSHVGATFAPHTDFPRSVPAPAEEVVSLPTSLSSTEDAIRLAGAALGDDDLVAIVDGETKLVMPITGRVPSDAVLGIDELMLQVAGDHDGNRLVLVTRRHHGPSFVLESELELWRRMQAAHAGRALPLVEWLVFLDDDIVLSLAELAGPRAVWA